MAEPKPVPENVVCSECGLPWNAHGADPKVKPTLEMCVQLLKAELAKPRPEQYWPTQITSSSGVSPLWRQSVGGSYS